MEGPGADSEEKRVLASDVDTVLVDSLKALDPNRPIREAEMAVSPNESSLDYPLLRRDTCKFDHPGPLLRFVHD